MDLDFIDMHLPKLCFHNEDTDKLMYNKAFLILSVKIMSCFANYTNCCRIWAMCRFQANFESMIISPKNLVEFTCLMLSLLIFNFSGSFIFLFLALKRITCVFLMFKVSLFTCGHLDTFINSLFIV